MIHLALAAALAGRAAPAAQDAAPPTLRALRLANPGEEVRVDGRLDEPAWRRAEAASGFRQREPAEGEGATEDTEVRVLYDTSHLYVGVLARDREPGKVIARILQRDRLMEPSLEGRHRFAGDDAVAILLDPFRDRRNAVVFATNPNGAEFDALITDEAEGFNADWRGVWRVAAQRVPEGWSAEFAIPFRTLRYPPGPEARPWGFNVYRVIRRKNEETLWSGWSREGGGFHRVSRAGSLEGLARLPRAGLNLELKPFGLAGLAREREEAGAETTDEELDGGLDLKYEVRPGLVLDVTLNPDFAQVEADEEQVNLTRFDLFFPEKRDFFLENAGIFEFGVRGVGEPPPFLLFFSRSVGIAEDGEVPVTGGVRLTGRLGKQTLGLLDAVTGEALGERRTNWGVLRVKRDVGGSNYVGAMATDRRREGASNTAFGLDASFWPAGAVNVQAFLARTETTGPGGDDTAYRVSVDYAGDRFGFTGQHLMIGPEANAEAGFVTRTDIRRTDLIGRVTARPKALGLRKIDTFLFGQGITRVDGETQDWGVGPGFSFEWGSGEAVTVYGLRGFTRLDEAFDLSDRVPVPAGDYDLRLFGYFARTGAHRPLAVTSQGSLLRVYGGRLVSVGGTVRLAAGSHLALTAGYTHNDVDLPGGDFTAGLASLRVALALSTRLSASAFIQYNGLDKKLLANLRVNLIHRPGSDLFIAFNEERGSERSAWDFAGRRLAVKLTYLVRF